MVDARDLGDMVDMVGDHRQGDDRFGIGLFPFRQRLLRALGITDIEAAKGRGVIAGHFRAARRAPDPAGLRHILRREIDHDHAAIGRDLLQDRVGHVARCVAQGARAGMGEDDWCLADLQCVQHHAFADMGEVDQHAQAVEFMHHRLAERGEAVMLRIVGGAVGPGDGPAVGQRQIAGAKVMIGAQHGQAAVDLAAAFDPDHRRDPSGLVRGTDLGSGGGEGEVLRVAAGEAVDQFDLLDRVLHLLQFGQVGRHPDGPELPAHLPGPQAGDVGMILAGIEPVERHGPAGVPGLAGHRFGPVIMAVDQRGGLQHLGDSRGIAIGCGRGRGGEGEGDGGEEQRQGCEAEGCHGAGD